MKMPRVYLDTSVIGGCFDDEFKVWSNVLIEDIKKGMYKPVTSEVVAAEVADAPEYIQDKYRDLIGFDIENLIETDESENLLNEYIQHKILTPKFTDDMNHIALATVAEVDIVVSWNFRHVVNYNKIRLFNAVNLECGYKMLAIHSPMEICSYEKN